MNLSLSLFHLIANHRKEKPAFFPQNFTDIRVDCKIVAILDKVCYSKMKRREILRGIR